MSCVPLLSIISIQAFPDIDCARMLDPKAVATSDMLHMSFYLPWAVTLDAPSCACDPETLILAYIHSCNPRYTNSLGMTLYDRMGVYEVVDITTVQCLVGRVPRKWPDPDFYAIVDRSSSVNRSIYVPDDD